VNNAGVALHGAALDVSEEQWRTVWDVNVDGLWNCSRIVGEQMVRRGSGAIVNIGSMSALIVNRPQMQHFLKVGDAYELATEIRQALAMTNVKFK
ncbi:MAG TPA: SDR family NAD(P)-dependent oxidoreductase, partial [Solirubrobacteraceae bacterium]